MLRNLVQKSPLELKKKVDIAGSGKSFRCQSSTHSRMLFPRMFSDIYSAPSQNLFNECIKMYNFLIKEEPTKVNTLINNIVPPADLIPQVHICFYFLHVRLLIVLPATSGIYLWWPNGIGKQPLFCVFCSSTMFSSSSSLSSSPSVEHLLIFLVPNR